MDILILNVFNNKIKTFNMKLDIMPCLSIAVNTFITPLKSVGEFYNVLFN